MENKKTIQEKLLEFQSTVETIKKDGANSFFKKPDGKASSYATLPNILENVKPILNALKILVTQPILNGNVYTRLTCTETKEFEECFISLPTGLNAQQTGSAITYYRRYTITSLLALEIDEDDDGNKASQPNKPEHKEAEKKETIWLSQDQFDAAMKADKKGILATLNAFNGKLGKSMKKDFSQKLTAQLEFAK